MTPKNLLLSLLLLSSFASYAQQPSEKFTYVDQVPEFPGNLAQYLGENLHYPEIAQLNNIEGRVNIRFVIDESGNVTEVEVIKSVYPAIDSEAVRVITAMPKWKPGRQKDRAVKVFHTQPILMKRTDNQTTVSLDSNEAQFLGPRYRQYDTFPYYLGNTQQALTIDTTDYTEGAVYLLVTISEKGVLTNPRPLSDPPAEALSLALERVKTLNNAHGKAMWKPATKDGKAIPCDMILPITFNEK